MPLLGAKRSAITGIRVPRKRELPQDLLFDPGVLAEDFEASTDWTASNGSAANDAVNYKTGTQGVKLTSSGAGTTYMDKTVSLDLSSSQFVRIWIYPTATTQATIYLASVAWTKYMLIGTGTLTANSWNLIQRPRSSFVIFGGMTWSDTVTKIRVQWVATGAGEEYTFDGFYTNVLPAAAMVLSFDDNPVSVFTEAFTYARKYGINATAFIISDLIDDSGSMSTEQMGIMNDHGWDLGNHSMDATNFSSLSQSEIETKLTTCQGILDAAGFTRASQHVSYPSGGYDADSHAAMAATGMLTGRTVISANWYLPEVNNYIIPAREIKNTTSLDTVKDLIKTAMDQRTILFTFMHNIVSDPSTSTQWSIRDWRALCDYIAMSQIPTLTISQLYALESGAVTVDMPY
jgi:peptidoglycan/xylan/chitin deacetylase (PgdA/CDA1 family)